ncbi:hypothetical protein BH09SUM1_BH09SUM1_26060 [soil metagenome]
MEGHAIHRIHEFLPHLAERQPDLMELLPESEQPHSGIPLGEWVLGLPQRRLMEICSSWVVESLRRLKETSPLTNVLLRGCLTLGGEFDVSDAAAVAVGERVKPGDPRREEVRLALNRAARVGVLIHLPKQERYCVPFPVRLSFEGVDFLEPMEREEVRLRQIRHFSLLCRELMEQPDLASPKYWRFSNLLAAYEMAVDMMEELLGFESSEWMEAAGDIDSVPEMLVEPLADFGRFLGKSLIFRQSVGGARLIAATAAAARTSGDLFAEAQAHDLLGQFFLRRSQFPQAIDFYRRAEALRQAGGDDEGAVLAITAIAIAYRESENPEQAIAEFYRACHLARESGLREPEIDTANCLARLLIESDRAFEASQLITGIVEGRKTARRYPAEAELLVLLATALRLEKRFANAREKLFAALALARDFLHRPAEAESYLELGRLHQLEENHDEAMKWIRKARSLFAEFTDHRGVAQCYLALSQSIRVTQDGEPADELLTKALRSANTAKDMTLVAAIWRERAFLHLDEDDATTALSHFLQEIKALRHTHHVARLVRAHMHASELYLREESFLAAGAEVLRAQGLSRAYLREDEPADLAMLFGKVSASLSPAQVDYLVQDVTEELESGALRGQR